LCLILQPAEATEYDIYTQLEIPSIDLTSDVARLRLEGHELSTPEMIVGGYSQSSNKVLLIGHSTTVFQNLENVAIGDRLTYGEKGYIVESAEVFAKSQINMGKLLAAEKVDTVVIMTCAGESLAGGDATHRLIVTATADADVATTHF